jgi:hypothetical protein
VYNKNEDFYKMIELGKVPEYDVLVTNPPYSGENMEILLKFVTSSSKPSLLLVPNYVYTKDYYVAIMRRVNPPPSFLVPTKRYLYSTPYGRRQAKSAKYTSPFPTFWYCFLGPKHHSRVSTFFKLTPTEYCKFSLNANLLPMEVSNPPALLIFFQIINNRIICTRFDRTMIIRRRKIEMQKSVKNIRLARKIVHSHA